jgi:hypothetical protein
VNEPKPVIVMPDVSRVRRDEPPARVSPLPTNPMEMLALAVSQGAEIDKLERLMVLKREWEEGEARKAFVEALAGFKAEPLTIKKDKHVNYPNSKGGSTDYWHATIGNVVNVVAPALSRYGLSYRWKTEQLDGGMIRVTCILTHVKGHSEETSLSSSRDDSGGKNNIQAVGSTVSYLERYTLLALLGLATSDQADDDGLGSVPAPVENPPDGYSNWHADMVALADEGLPRLTGAWEKASPAFRRYVVKFDEPWWIALKKRAGMVQP